MHKRQDAEHPGSFCSSRLNFVLHPPLPPLSGYPSSPAVPLSNLLPLVPLLLSPASALMLEHLEPLLWNYDSFHDYCLMGFDLLFIYLKKYIFFCF